MLGAIALAVAAFYLRDHVDQEIRCRVLEQFTRHYQGLKVTVRAAELVEGEGIKVRGLSITDPDLEGPHAELLHLEEVTLRCDATLRKLVCEEPKITAVTIRHPTLRLVRLADGTYTAGKLLPLPKLSDSPPPMVIEEGTVEIVDPSSRSPRVLTLSRVDLALDPPDPKSPSPAARGFRGTFQADYARQVQIEGTIDPRQMAWSLAGSLEGLQVCPELHKALGGVVPKQLGLLGALRGEASLDFRVAYDPASGMPPQFDVGGRLQRGRIDDPRLPHSLTDIRASIRANNQGFAIDEMVARSAPAIIRLSAHHAGWEFGRSPLALSAEIRQLPFGADLLPVLPPQWQEHWYKYRPEGVLDAEVKLAFDGRVWRSEASVRCENLSFTHYKFPYRLQYGQGAIELKDDLLELNLRGLSGSEPVLITSEVRQPFSAPAGWAVVRGDNIEIDEKLLIALPDRQRAMLRSLSPRGTFDFQLRLTNPGPGQPLGKNLLMTLRRCAVRYEKFPYPVSNIRGTVAMVDDHWTFRDLEGTNDIGRVTCGGTLGPTPHGPKLHLELAGRDIVMEEELRDALKPNIQRVWNDLRPRGRVDLAADIRYLAKTRQLSVGVWARPQSATASIEPVRFPYRLEKLQGELVYRDGHVVLKRFRAEHGQVEMAAGGQCDFLDDGTWHLQLEGLTVDRLAFDRDLIQALPDRFRQSLAALRPTGPLNLRGSLGIRGPAVAGGPVRYQWNMAVGFHQGSIDCGIKLENLHGSVALTGGFDGRRFQSRGELAIDSLTYKDYQFTQVTGPMWIDDQRVLFGKWVAQRDDPQQRRAAPTGSAEKPRPITATLFGGQVAGDAWVALGRMPRYALHATLTDAELSRCAEEVVPGRQNLRGKILASLHLHGSGRSVHTLGGHGRIRLRQADIYELPLMIALLKILSIQEPDPNAFSDSDIDFRVVGNHVYFDRINFNGDAISLEGQGEMDLQAAVRLTFRARLGRQEWNVPLVSDLMGGASEQMMQIYVTGTLQDPKMEQVAFPGVNRALQQLQRDLQAARPQNGSVLPVPLGRPLPGTPGALRR